MSVNLPDKKKPFVIYKKPQSGTVRIWQQKNTQLYTSETISDNAYYFVPFDFSKYPAVVFHEEDADIYEITLKDLNAEGLINISNPLIQDSDVTEYQKKVKKAIDLIQNSVLQKIVLSRSFKVDFDDFDIYNAVARLMRTYDNSYVYLWHHPEIGTWMGATPELLINYQNGQVKTVSLAGTVTDFLNKGYSKDIQDNLIGDAILRKAEMPDSWGVKEFNEQQIVTDYIVESLKKFTTNIKVGKPQTVRQGHLEHIKTDISAILRGADLTGVIRQLHPTPAVCGLPIETAKRYIKQIEDYDRKYYTGFLGEKRDDTVSMYVNLRCMEVLTGALVLYVGGGIVSGSQPAKEWQEILLKSKVLLTGLTNYDS